MYISKSLMLWTICFCLRLYCASHCSVQLMFDVLQSGIVSDRLRSAWCFWCFAVVLMNVFCWSSPSDSTAAGRAPELRAHSERFLSRIRQHHGHRSSQHTLPDEGRSWHRQESAEQQLDQLPQQHESQSVSAHSVSNFC